MLHKLGISSRIDGTNLIIDNKHVPLVTCVRGGGGDDDGLGVAVDQDLVRLPHYS